MGCTTSINVVENNNLESNNTAKNYVQDPPLFNDDDKELDNEKDKKLMKNIKPGNKTREAATKLIQKTFRGLIGRNRATKKRLWRVWNELEYKEEKEQSESFEVYKNLKREFVNKMAKDIDIDSLVHEPVSNLNDSLDMDDIDSKLLETIVAVRSKHQINKVREKDRKRGSIINNIASMSTLLKNIEYSSMIVPNNITNIDNAFILNMIDEFNEGRSLTKDLTDFILDNVADLFKDLPNIVPIHITNQIKLTVVGDIHGQIGDLLTMFKLNGMPGLHNHYLFNGDIVDRGIHSMECLLLILALKILHPESILINRGNHETEDMVAKHGFEKECLTKYDIVTFKKIINIFTTLPIAHLIEDKIFVVHGGISNDDDITLDMINKIDRFKAILEPYSLFEDLLWSDPRDINGRSDSNRGAGCLFGSEPLDNFLKVNNLELMIRSHECVDDGYEAWFDQRCITIFSASNYCGLMENNGAFMLFDKSLSPTIVTFSAFNHDSLGPSAISKVSKKMQKEIIQKLIVRIAQSRLDLEYYFHEKYPNSINITRKEWSDGLNEVLDLKIPFLLFQSQLGLPLLGVKGKPKGPIDYVEFLDQYKSLQIKFAKRIQKRSSLPAMTQKELFDQAKIQSNYLTDTNLSKLISILYKNREHLDSLFRFFDVDGNGTVTIEEFIDAVLVLLSILDDKHTITRENMTSFAKSLDRNADGNVDYDEFFSLFEGLDEIYTSVIHEKDNIDDALDSIMNKGTITPSYRRSTSLPKTEDYQTLSKTKINLFFQQHEDKKMKIASI